MIKQYNVSGAAKNTAANTEVSKINAIGNIVGDVGQEDIVIPRLNIVQGVGQLSETHSIGQIVYDKSVVLSDGPTPVEVTVMRARKQFIENLPYGSDGPAPQVFDTLEEVRAVGGTIEWNGNQKPSFLPVLHVQVLIKVPEGVEGAFPLLHDGQRYAIALWTIRGTAYSRAAKNILTAARFSLSSGLHHGKWVLTTKREKFGRNSVFVPQLALLGKHDEEFVKFVEGLV